MQDYSDFSILLVDDERDICEFLADEFSEIGFSTDCACGVQKAIKLISENVYDVIISDFKMPDGDGLQVLSAANSSSYEPHFYFISGQADIYPEEAEGLGAKKFYTKPFDIDELIENVKVNLAKLVARS